jgi:hypothetical protein
VSRVVFDARASFIGFMNSLDEVVDEDMGLVSSCWSHADAIGWLPLARLCERGVDCHVGTDGLHSS